MINPANLNWGAPTENTDGTPIAGTLNYRLQVDGVDFIDFPGILNPDGRFYQDIPLLGLTDGAHTLGLKAFYVDQPALISDISNLIDVILGVARPNPPFAFAAA